MLCRMMVFPLKRPCILLSSARPNRALMRYGCWKVALRILWYSHSPIRAIRKIRAIPLIPATTVSSSHQDA